ncbi:MAG: FISUMP domain-containing protein, partial [Bacteroidota bacterium]|nr:FISUMP domain-containing protein [Bacteroidota bacterium]
MKHYILFMFIIYRTVSLFPQITNNPSTGEILKDIDGNIYSTTTIGDQVWMAENLKVTHYYDGMDIPLIADKKTWKNLTIGGYCWYNNDSMSCFEDYGALYNWDAVVSGKLCPSGW